VPNVQCACFDSSSSAKVTLLKHWRDAMEVCDMNSGPSNSFYERHLHSMYRNCRAVLICALLPMLLCSVLRAQVTGTNNDDLLFFQGQVQQLNTTLTNAYSGETIAVAAMHNVNTETYNGLGGTDTLLMTNANEGDYLSLENEAGAQALFSVERIAAGDGNDIVNLSSATYTLGDTLIDGGLADDILWGNSGNDTIYGHEGNDRLDGGPGDDFVSGGDDDDIVDGGTANDIVNGDAGNDTLVYTASQNVGNTDIYDGGTGIDALVLKLTTAQNNDYAADIAAARAFIAAHYDDTSSNGPTYTFSSFGLTISNIEAINVVITNPPLYASGGTCFGEAGHQILQPINTDGTSVWKRGATIPAKFRVCDASGTSVGTPGVVTSFRLIQVIAGTISPLDEAVTSTTADTAFRWDATAKQWIFNINTKGLSSNQTYVFQIGLNDGSSIFFRFGLK
jgi:hypothetical protein